MVVVVVVVGTAMPRRRRPDGESVVVQDPNGDGG
jgi:hypothetical protein